MSTRGRPRTRERTLRRKIPPPNRDGTCSDLCPLLTWRKDSTGKARRGCALYLNRAYCWRLLPGEKCPHGRRGGAIAEAEKRPGPRTEDLEGEKPLTG